MKNMQYIVNTCDSNISNHVYLLHIKVVPVKLLFTLTIQQKEKLLRNPLLYQLFYFKI